MCYPCDAKDGCCAIQDTFDNATGGECPLKCTCDCNPDNWCKRSCDYMDECKDSIWASYNCPKERDDDADIYCKTAGLGVASIVVLGVTVVMIMIMCMMCCLHQRNKGSASKVRLLVLAFKNCLLAT